MKRERRSKLTRRELEALTSKRPVVRKIVSAEKLEESSRIRAGSGDATATDKKGGR